MREDVTPQRYQPRVYGNWGRGQDRQVRQLQRNITKKVKVSALEFDGIMDPNAFCRAPKLDPTVNRIRRRGPHETICQNTFHINILIYEYMISLLIHSLI